MTTPTGQKIFKSLAKRLRTEPSKREPNHNHNLIDLINAFDQLEDCLPSKLEDRLVILAAKHSLTYLPPPPPPPKIYNINGRAVSTDNPQAFADPAPNGCLIWKGLLYNGRAVYPGRKPVVPDLIRTCGTKGCVTPSHHAPTNLGKSIIRRRLDPETLELADLMKKGIDVQILQLDYTPEEIEKARKLVA